MSSPNSVRQRTSASSKKKAVDGNTASLNGNAAVAENIEVLKQKTKEAVTSNWDYKLALTIITFLAFLTRFWGISHPNQVVFDEVHFGKVGGLHTYRGTAS